MTDTDADRYRAEWSARTGRSPSEIYVPLSLRDPAPTPEFYGVPGTPSGDGDATGGGPYTPGSAIEEFGGEG